MNPTPENLERLDKIMALLNDGTVKPEELLAAVDALSEAMAKVQRELSAALAKAESKARLDLDALTGQLRRIEGQGRELVEKRVAALTEAHQAELMQLRSSLVAEVARVEALIPELPPGYDDSTLRTALEGHQKALDNLSFLITGENVRNALEALPEGDKLAIEAVEGLRAELDELKARPVASGSTHAVTGRDIITKYDLSPYLDGVTKTFNIPATWAVISVACSSFPNVLRPVIDYTNTPTTITFTSQIEASTTLSAGQTVVLILVTA